MGLSYVRTGFVSHLHTKYYLMARDTSTYTYAVASGGSRVGTFTYSVSLLRLTFTKIRVKTVKSKVR